MAQIKSVITLFILSLAFFSCADENNARNEFLNYLIKEDSLILAKKDQVTRDGNENIEKINQAITGLSNTRGSKKIIDSLLLMKNQITQTTNQKILEIERQQLRNNFMRDSVLALMSIDDENAEDDDDGDYKKKKKKKKAKKTKAKKTK